MKHSSLTVITLSLPYNICQPLRRLHFGWGLCPSSVHIFSDVENAVTNINNIMLLCLSLNLGSVCVFIFTLALTGLYRLCCLVVLLVTGLYRLCCLVVLLVTLPHSLLTMEKVTYTSIIKTNF